MTPKDYVTNKNFCPVPWTGIYLGPDGEVNSCCLQDANTALGNINDVTAMDAVASAKNIAIKSKMLEGKEVTECKQCYIQPNSLRVHYIKQLRNVPLSTYDSDENFVLSTLDVRFRNTCNLACVYCVPELSSKIASELGIQNKIYNQDNLTQSVAYINQNLKTLKNVYLAGGEPLLIKENLTLLKQLYADNPNVTLRVNTNLTTINNEIFNEIIKFKNLEWIVSIESIGEKFEYIRYHADWKNFVKNLMLIKSMGHNITFNMVWFSLSTFEIFNAIDFLMDAGFLSSSFTINCSDTPSWIDVRHLDKSLVARVVGILTSRKLNLPITDLLYKNYDSMSNFIQQPFDKNINLLYNELSAIDSRRNLNSRKTFPELF